jgi:predicted RNase H-like HicB family nuclease
VLPPSLSSGLINFEENEKMETKLRMVYWKGDKFWVGKLIDHPEVMTQGKTLKELEENIIDAYKLLVLDEVPEDHEAKEIVIAV